MNYQEFELGSFCYKCRNEKFNLDFKFCPICGLPRTNKCTGKRIYSPWSDTYEVATENACKQDLPGNYRYCPDCGSESLYLIEEILPSWEEEIKNDTDSNADGEDYGVPF